MSIDGNGDLYQAGLLAFRPTPSTLLASTKQLVNAQWPRPLIWLVQVQIEPIQITPFQSAVYTAEITTIIGAGQGSTELKPYIFMAPAGGVNGNYGIFLGSGRVPAHDVQIRARLYGTPNLSQGTSGTYTERWDISVYVAPWGIEQLHSPIEREHIEEWGVNYPQGIHSGMLSRREKPTHDVLPDMRWGDRDSIQYSFTQVFP